MNLDPWIKTIFIACDCLECDHVLRLDYFNWLDDDDTPRVEVGILSRPWRSLPRRVIDGIKYIFGSDYLHHGIGITIGTRAWASLVEFVNRIETETR